MNKQIHENNNINNCAQMQSNPTLVFSPPSFLSVHSGSQEGVQMQVGDELSTVAVFSGPVILAALYGVPCPVHLQGDSHCWTSSPLLRLLYRHHFL